MHNVSVSVETTEFHKLFGVRVNALTITSLNTLIEQAVKQQQRWIIANHNLHSIYLYHQDIKMRYFYEKANYIHVDGMILVFLGKLLGLPLGQNHRVTYVDWIPHLIAKATEQNWRVFFLGAKPGVAEKGAEILRQQFPGLQIATAHGYFDVHGAENQAILDAIQTYKPHVLMVGMSMPRQEHWILDNLEQLTANVILPAGAAIDYVAGVVPTPPRWTGKIGLEWLFRLISEPKRLWQRYLIEPWFLLQWLLKKSF